MFTAASEVGPTCSVSPWNSPNIHPVCTLNAVSEAPLPPIQAAAMGLGVIQVPFVLNPTLCFLHHQQKPSWGPGPAHHLFFLNKVLLAHNHAPPRRIYLLSLGALALETTWPAKTKILII